MIHHQLKKLRQDRGLTLKELSAKVGYGTGNLSSYENGKLKAKDETILRILMRGFGMTKKEAGIKVAQWRKEELEETYHLELAQTTTPYNKGKRVSSKTLDDFLKEEGFDAKTIQKIKKEIEKYRH